MHNYFQILSNWHKIRKIKKMKSTHTHTHIYIYIYIYKREREREKERERYHDVIVVRKYRNAYYNGIVLRNIILNCFCQFLISTSKPISSWNNYFFTVLIWCYYLSFVIVSFHYIIIIMQKARISLTLFRHLSLSYITSDKSSWLHHPLSVQMCFK